jgi:Flp pilus assembly protein TadD
MRRRSSHFSRLAGVAVALAMLPLAACSTTDLGGFSAVANHGSETSRVPELGNPAAEQALAEARTHFRDGDFGYSANLYKQVVTLAPKSPEGYIGLSASYDRLGRFDLSDRVYAALYALTGDTAQYYNNLGYSYLLRGDLRAALGNFRKAQRLAPDNVVVANNLRILANAAAGRA